MSGSVFIDRNLTKDKQYEALAVQAKALLSGESDTVANMANCVAILKEVFGWFWIGFYRAQNNELVLGPFQGPIACTRIAKGKGVCGAVFESGITEVVPDVDQFPGHIACSSLSKSEIVLPVFDSDKKVKAVLDIDSTELNSFDEGDKQGLELILRSVEEWL